MFLEDSGGPERTNWRLGTCSIAAAVRCPLTAEDAAAGLVAVLAVQWWWLEEKRLVLV